MVRKLIVIPTLAAIALGAVAGTHHLYKSGALNPFFETPKGNVEAMRRIFRTPIPTYEPEGTLCRVVADSSRALDTQSGKEAKPGVKLVDGMLNVFYETGSHTIAPVEKRKLVDYLRFFPSKSRFIVDGFADYRHSDVYNRDLSRRRAEGVVEIIKSALPNSSVKIAGHGKDISRPEGTDLQSIWHDRRVRIFPSEETFNASRDLFTADYYLVDASEKMGEQINPSVGVTKLDVANLYPFPKNAEVYTFNSIWRKCGKTLADERPKGENNLYNVLANFIDNKAQPNSSIVVLVGTASHGINFLEHFTVIDMANRKKVRVSFSYSGIDSKVAQSLQTLAASTGGNMYSQANFLSLNR